MTSTSKVSASEWLVLLSDAVNTHNVDAFTDLFLPDGWFRDVLVFSWNARSLEGPDKIRQYIQDALPTSTLTNVFLDERPHLGPSIFPAFNGVSGVQFAFTFENPAMRGRGYARIVPQKVDVAAWKALSLYMAVDGFKGHEELGEELGVYGGHTFSWEEVREARKHEVENDPEVLIFGAGQTGLMIAARLKQMRFRTLIVERSGRIGDIWRQRYPTLSLHTPRSHSNFLYAPFPSNWPTYTPRDKLASWMEHYVDSQDLVVWLSSGLASPPTYGQSTKKWTVIISHNDDEVTLHPSHIVLATGVLGKPNIPAFRDLELFKGESFHSFLYQGGRPYIGKRVIVIGAGNTSADICQDLTVHGAAEVTMIQRSSTCISSAALLAKLFDVSFPEGVPTEVSDFKVAAMPLGLLKKILISQKEENLKFDKDLHDALKKNGVNLSYGPDGAGLLFQVQTRFGGYWIDVGCANLISNGKIEVKSGAEIDYFTESGIVFKDGVQLDADVIIFATGYENIRQTLRNEFGADLIDRTSPVWGLDEECELRGCYRPSGQPGLWFGAGGFPNARYGSKQLALLIRAEQLGLTKHANAASIS